MTRRAIQYTPLFSCQNTLDYYFKNMTASVHGLEAARKAVIEEVKKAYEEGDSRFVFIDNITTKDLLNDPVFLAKIKKKKLDYQTLELEVTKRITKIISEHEEAVPKAQSAGVQVGGADLYQELSELDVRAGTSSTETWDSRTQDGTEVIEDIIIPFLTSDDDDVMEDASQEHLNWKKVQFNDVVLQSDSSFNQSFPNLPTIRCPNNLYVFVHFKT